MLPVRQAGEGICVGRQIIVGAESISALKFTPNAGIQNHGISGGFTGVFFIICLICSSGENIHAFVVVNFKFRLVISAKIVYNIIYGIWGLNKIRVNLYA